MIKFISNKGHLYFAAAQHTSNVLQISGEFPVLWVYLPKVDVWNLLSQAPLQLGPKGVIRGSKQPSERLQIERKKWEEQGISWNTFWRGRRCKAKIHPVFRGNRGRHPGVCPNNSDDYLQGKLQLRRCILPHPILPSFGIVSYPISVFKKSFSV